MDFQLWVADGTFTVFEMVGQQEKTASGMLSPEQQALLQSLIKDLKAQAVEFGS